MRKFFVLFFIIVVTSGCAINENTSNMHQTLYSVLNFVDQKNSWDDAECGHKKVYVNKMSAAEEYFLDSKEFLKKKKAVSGGQSVVFAQFNMFGEEYTYYITSARLSGYSVLHLQYIKLAKDVKDYTMLRDELEKVCK